ncbi:DUF5667 domain-containing protein [Paenibacillus sp. BSR1-1]|uniref:DUF5667 domain-containing protein n=1 Tax=Paenibacillus sp. BSR1-1 TaxID=3020845 RepID=UPI0025B229E3|nr:DUF5667 domain-containing protein [Paenibacillus sp. BSR1-1]MDN3019029.1 DUF5667 domain-containing protein [Paenibacillus sp. BSR1-1]
MKHKKISNLVTSGMLASTLIFSFGAGSAFANGDGTEATTDSTVTTDQVQNGTDQIETKTDQNGTDQVEGEATTEQVKVETPSLVPGDFFYFVKTLTEKIQLAFTFDDYKQAQLLADFASERIAEANALFADGKTEEAAALLKEAIATQEEASQTLPATKTNSTDDSQSAEEGEVETKLAHNIDALCAAVAHVKNPTAQQAIMKNVQKSFAKLAKKATKLEEKDAKFAEKMGQIEDKFVSGKVSDDEAVKAKHKLPKEHKQEEEATEVEKTEQERTNVAEDHAKGQQIQAAANKAEAANKAVEKQQAAVKKADAKQQEAASKVQVKQHEAVKNSKENKQDNDDNQHGQGNGKGNH